jgi:hypothetical protein
VLTTRYENIIFYMDISGTTLKRKELTKCIITYIKVKKEKNPLTNFGILFFKENGTPDLLVDQSDSQSIIKKIDEEWQERNTQQNFLENGLFLCLSHIAEKAKKQNADHRIIIISDAPSNKSEEYQQALLLTLNNVKFFPTYVDIIRIGQERFYSDDVKLRIVTSTASGGLFYAEDIKSLAGILQALTNNKRLASMNQPDGKIMIDEENRMFYERLATDLLTPDLGESGICAICNKVEYEGEDVENAVFIKCYNCNAFFHANHAAIYSFENNIGLINLFRCPKCEVLLKIDEKFLLSVNGIDPSTFKSAIIEDQEPLQNESNIVDEIMSGMEDSETEQNDALGSSEELVPNVEEEITFEPLSSDNIFSNESNAVESNTQPQTNQPAQKAAPLRPGGFGFFQRSPMIQSHPLNSNENSQLKSPNNEVWCPPNVNSAQGESVAVKMSSLSPPGNEAEVKRRKPVRSFKLCMVCGVSNTGEVKLCKNCGAPV